MYKSQIGINKRKWFTWLSFVSIGLFFISLYGCGSTNSGGYTFSESSKRIKLNVGEIKEISLTSTRDSTWQIVGSSENKEIVDVTSKEDPTEETTTTTVPAKGNLTFLVKGVTPGSVRITFAEKQKEAQGPGRTLKSYTVNVVTE